MVSIIVRVDGQEWEISRRLVRELELHHTDHLVTAVEAALSNFIVENAQFEKLMNHALRKGVKEHG